ncbi:hypothetical protein PENSPDRAFT_464775 [Peniophora sp. CONT]|nr:hypothetical protein PENSPDRAFT_464775 [Peniophora sp. CONT]
MPKLISRLVRRLNQNKGLDRLTVRSPKRKTRPRTLFSERPPPPDWFGPRSQSILQDDANPLTQRRTFQPHKRLPPRVVHSQHVLPSSLFSTADDEPREMTDQERDWWANPYLRILSSPLRKCVLTGVNLPSEFLVRITPRRVSLARESGKGQRSIDAILGDGLEHPKFRSLRDRRGFYVLCRSDVFDRFKMQVTWRKYLRDNPVIDAPTVIAQIGHLLRLRILQEVELLTARIQARPQAACETSLVRRLSRAELSALRATGALPYEDAAAVLILPPLNKDPETKSRPTVNATPLPDTGAVSLAGSRTPKYPLSELLPPRPVNDSDNPPLDAQPRQTPLYNGVALFPSRGQRAALHEGLSKLLAVERESRFREHGRDLHVNKTNDSMPARGDEKASHAFIVRSGRSTLLRADTVPLAIALWRLRMWEGSPWRDNTGTWLDIA